MLDRGAGRGRGRGGPSSGGRGGGRGGVARGGGMYSGNGKFFCSDCLMVVTINSLEGGRGGGGSRGRGRGRGGNTFKKSGPDDPRIGSSVQIFVEGLPQVHTFEK